VRGSAEEKKENVFDFGFLFPVKIKASNRERMKEKKNE
jgi:hypothetical protein